MSLKDEIIKMANSDVIQGEIAVTGCGCHFIFKNSIASINNYGTLVIRDRDTNNLYAVFTAPYAVVDNDKSNL